MQEIFSLAQKVKIKNNLILLLQQFPQGEGDD
jgi:hypothetical protein